MVDINASLFFQIANFLLMVIVMNYLVYRPIRKVLRERREKFAAFESEIGTLTTRTDERVKEIEVRLAEARKDAFQKKDELKGLGLEEEKQILAGASTEAENEVQKIRDQIKGEIVAARDALKADVQIFSQELATKILGRSLS